VNVLVLDVPAEVVTDTVRAPVVAPDEMLTDAVTLVAEVDWTFDTVIPVDGVKLTAVAPVRLVP